jgi:dTDP-glucose 4,6-dehydratase
MLFKTTPAKILLTGGTGFFGKALLRHWKSMEAVSESIPMVTVLSRNPYAFQAKHPDLVKCRWLNFVEGDICVKESLPKNLTFTHVLHAAADSTLGPQLTPRERFDQIINGTLNLLEIAVNCGASKFLLASSGAVYGPQSPEIERISEECSSAPDSLNPFHAYGVAKRTAEHLCSLYQHEYGLNTVVARCFAFVGPDLPFDVHFAIGNFIRDALHADVITVQGDGSPLRSYMDQRDLARWLLALLNEAEGGQAYNVGSDHEVSILDLAHIVRDVLAPRKSIRIIGAGSASAIRNRYVPSIDKARKDLGLQVTVELEDAIRFAAAQYQGCDI